MSNLRIRPEQPNDFRRIADVVESAFGNKAVAELVERIRNSKEYVAALSMVAERDDRVVGHIMLSRVHLRSGSETFSVLQLSPLAVDPTVQRSGIGSTLVSAALSRADEQQEPLVVLEGDPNYYRRFGFVSAEEHGVRMHLPSWAPPEAAMALALSAYQLSKPQGEVMQTDAFRLLPDDLGPPPARGLGDLN